MAAKKKQDFESGLKELEALVERMELQEDGTLSIRFRFRDALEALRGADGGGAA